MVVAIPCGSLADYQAAWGTDYNYSEFNPDFTVSLTANDDAWGTVAIQQQDGHDVACDSTAIITATPNEGFVFTRWSDGNTDNPRTLHLTGDTSFVAQFGCLPTSVDTTITACDSFTWNVTGETYMRDTTLSSKLPILNSYGCDSTVTLHLTILSGTHNVESQVVCDSLLWNGSWYREEGTYTYAYTNADGCASADTLHLAFGNDTLTIGNGRLTDNYLWGNSYYNYSVSEQIYRQQELGEAKSLSGMSVQVGSADHARNISIYLGHTDQSSVDSWILPGDMTLVWSGTTHYTADSWNDIEFTTPFPYNGSDNLLLIIADHTGTYQTKPDNSVYTHNNMGYNSRYVCSDNTHYSAAAMLMLTGNATSLRTNVRWHHACSASAVDSVERTVCRNQLPYNWDGVVFDEAGTQQTTLPNGHTVVMTLHVVNKWSSHEQVTSCGSYLWDVNGKTYNKSGVKTYKSVAEDGCPAYDTLTLTVATGHNSHEYVTHCGSYTWELDGRTYNKSGNKYHRGSTPEGCPVRDTLTLVIVDKWVNHEQATSCGPYTWDVDGKTYSQSGVKFFSGTAGDGCPVYDTLTLTVSTGHSSHEQVWNCGPYLWEANGQTYSRSGRAYHTGVNADGCPVRDTLTLTVVDKWVSREQVTSCGPYLWDVNGRTYNQSGVKTYKSVAADGCNVYDTLTLTVAQSRNSHEQVTHCGPYTWAVTGKTYNKSGNKYYKGTTAEGCPARDTLTLAVVDRLSNHEYVTSCGSYTWDVDGRTYNKSGEKYHKGTLNGCQVYDTLTLTIAQGRATHAYVTHCGPYTWEVTGQTYNKSGDKYYKSSTPEGCSIRDTLSLTINPIDATDTFATTTDRFTWYGTIFITSATAIRTLTNQYGCDSLVTLHLTVNPASGGTADYETELNLEESLAENVDENIDLNAGDDDNVDQNNRGEEILNSQLSILNFLRVYPNPTTGIVHIDFAPDNSGIDNFNFQFSTFNSKVEVLDLVGRRVALFENTSTLDLSHLPDGTYTLRIALPEGVTLRKVVVTGRSKN